MSQSSHLTLTSQPLNLLDAQRSLSARDFFASMAWFKRKLSRCQLLSTSTADKAAPASIVPPDNAFSTMKPNTPSTMHDGYESDNSSRLSMLSRSPSPPPGDNYPRDYPSPVSSEDSQLSELGSTPSPDNMAKTPQSSQNRDNPSPAKKRKLNGPKFKSCEHLDISSGEVSGDAQIQLERLLKVIHKKRKIVVVAGAGISVSAGIPDFRSSTGLFKTLKSEHNLKSSGKDLFDAAVYKDDNSTTSFHTMVRSLATTTRSATATPFHHMLATLAHEGRLLRLYTQNVDGIDTSLPPLSTTIPLERRAPWPKTVQLHGSLEKMVCTKCHQTSDLEPEIFDGPVPPTCPTCEESDGVRTQHAGKRSHGIGRLRPRMVLYNEHNPDDEAIGSVVKADMRTRPDALIVVGTTLKVPGVKRIVKEMSAIVRDRKDGGMAVWINNDDPPKDLEWNLIVKGPCDFVATSAALRQWNDPDHVEFTAEEVERIKAAKEVKVIINNSPSKNRLLDQATGVPTPAPSPILAPVDIKKKTSTIQTRIAPKKQPVKKAAVGAKAKKPAASKKNAAAKKTAAKTNTIKFKASKPNVQSMAKAEKPAKLESVADIKAAPQKRKSSLSGEDPQVFQPVSPSAARNNSNPPFKSPYHQALTPRKKPYRDDGGFPLGRLELEIQSDPTLPARPDWSPISSPVREGDFQSFDQPLTPIRENYVERPARESPEERNRIVTPTGPIPKGMSDILL